MLPSFKRFSIIPFIVLCVSACTKVDTTKVGIELIPPIDNIHTFDTTLDVIANTYEDTALPSPSQGSLHALGYTNDPLFGTSQASIFVALKPNNFKFSFPIPKDSLIAFDSAVLVLSYNGYYGDTNSNLSLQVFEINNDFTPDTAKIFYNTLPNVTYNNTAIGSATFAVKDFSKPKKIASGETVVNQLRIPIDYTFAYNNLFHNKDSTNIYASDKAFTDAFKGFAVVPTVGTGNALAYFDLMDNLNTRLEFHYRKKNVGIDTAYTSFISTYTSAHANGIKRNYTTGEISNHFTVKPNGDSLVYIQSSPGSYIKISTPELNAFKLAKGNVFIHRAELKAEQVYATNYASAEQVLLPAPYLFLDAIDVANKTFIPIPQDFQALSSGINFDYFGGRGIPATMNGNKILTYAFTLSKYVQNIVTRNAPIYDLRLYLPYMIMLEYGGIPLRIPFGNIAQSRVRLGGTNHSKQKMKLRIIYSKL